MMEIYRVVDKKNYLNGRISNGNINKSVVNTFEYDDEEYLHFFVLPEHAEIYQKRVYDSRGLDSLILKCDVPFSMLKDNFGAGMYKYYKKISVTPFLEVRLKAKDFDNKQVIGVAHEVPFFWKDEKIYNKYLNDVVEGRGEESLLDIDLSKDIIEQIEVNPKLNKNFNFFEYFPRKEFNETSKTQKKEIQTYKDMQRGKSNKSLKDKIKNVFTKKR